MNATNEFMKRLKNLGACSTATVWAMTKKNWKEVYNDCYRGDWLLWLFAKTNPDDVRLLALATGKCVETVIHLMEDQRSKDTVKAIIDFGEGKINKRELKKIVDIDYVGSICGIDIYDTSADIVSDADNAAAYAVAAYVLEDISMAVAASDAAEYAADAVDYADNTKKANKKQTANIVREIIPIEKFNV
jgi:hypothetical protein